MSAQLLDLECKLCPRLREFILSNRIKFPNYYNAPVPMFGDLNAQLLIIGLAPGLHGANRTGRPFTGDFAGDILYNTLNKFGFSQGDFDRNKNDTLHLKNCMIINAVKCVPPQNKPLGEEKRNCADKYLKLELQELLHKTKVILTLGNLAHNSITDVLQLKPKKNYPFKHGGIHKLDNGINIINSYHCSRYNINTNRLTQEMFNQIFMTIRQLLT